MTGVIFDVAMHYYNNDLSPGPPPDESLKMTDSIYPKNSMPPYCVVELTPSVSSIGKWGVDV